MGKVMDDCMEENLIRILEDDGKAKCSESEEDQPGSERCSI